MPINLLSEQEKQDYLENALDWHNSIGKQEYKYSEDYENRPDPRCQFCGKTCYKAEKATYNGVPYHKNCFRCVQCSKKMTPADANPIGDSVFVCNVHFNHVLKGSSANSNTVSASTPEVRSTGPSVVSGRSTLSMDYSEGLKWRKETMGKQTYRYEEDLKGPDKKLNPRCNKCGKTTYIAETVTYGKIPYHKNCFRCANCNNKLTAAHATPFGEDIFLCDSHYKQAITQGSVGDREVFSATHAPEEIRGPSVVSNASFSKADLSEGHKWRKAGVKQFYRYSEDFNGPNKRIDPRCQKCGKTSYSAETVTYEKIPYHRLCFRCVQCRKKLTPGEANPFGEAEFLCNTHFHQALTGMGDVSLDRASASSKEVKQTGPSVVIGTSTHEVDLAPGLLWRKAGKKQVYKYPEDKKGPSARNDPRCNKCGKTSYKAETVTYETIPYHKKCFRCLSCKKRMTPGNATPFGDDDFLCNVHFNQICFGGGGVEIKNDTASASTKQPEDKGPSSVTSANNEGVNPAIPAGYKWRVEKGKQTYKYPEDIEKGRDPRCNKCGKKAYRAEVITYESVPYHKNHFRCLQCNKRLTPGTATPFGEDVFLCDAHFAQFGQGGGYNESDLISADTPESKETGPSVVKEPKKVPGKRRPGRR